VRGAGGFFLCCVFLFPSKLWNEYNLSERGGGENLVAEKKFASFLFFLIFIFNIPFHFSYKD
jgi:hypothetical protein